MALNVSVGDIPSGPMSLVSLWICCLMPATRISKNSSRLLLKMVMNLTRSISGWVGSCASSRTRRLNSSQLSSRLIKFFGSPKRSCAVRAIVTVTGSTAALSSVSTLDCACAILIKIDNQSRITSAKALRRRGGGLVSDIFGRGGVNCILRDICCMIADTLETARNENQVEITAELLRVLCHPLSQFAVGHFIHVIKVFIASNDSAAKIDIFTHKGIDAVFEHRHRVRLNRPNNLYFGQSWMLVQLSRTPGNVRRLISNPLNVGRQFHRRDDATEIRRNWLKTQEHVDPVLVDLFFELVDLLVVGNRRGTKIIVTLE